MAFIRSKRTSAGAIYQVVRSEREGAQVRQVVLTSLGRYATLGAALESEHRGLAAMEQLPGHSA